MTRIETASWAEGTSGEDRNYTTDKERTDRAEREVSKRAGREQRRKELS
jgi:hypothetical protein